MDRGRTTQIRKGTTRAGSKTRVRSDTGLTDRPSRVRHNTSFVDKVLTGEGDTTTPVYVEMVEATPHVVIEHNLQNKSDFETSDFFMPLILLVLIFIVQFIGSMLYLPLGGMHAMFLVIVLQVALIRDLFKRINRRPSSKKMVGWRMPFKECGWGWAVAVYLLSLPLVIGAIWANEFLLNELFPSLAPVNPFEVEPQQGSLMTRSMTLFFLFMIFMMFFNTVVFAPLSEEIWFRGIGLAGFMQKGSRLRAVFWTSVIFGMLHGPSRFMFTTVLGVVFSLIRFRTGSLFCCIAMHALHNFGALVYAGYKIYQMMQNSPGAFGG